MQRTQEAGVTDAVLFKAAMDGMLRHRLDTLKASEHDQASRVHFGACNVANILIIWPANSDSMTCRVDGHNCLSVYGV